MKLWWFEDLEIWRFGDLEIWRFGDLKNCIMYNENWKIEQANFEYWNQNQLKTIDFKLTSFLLQQSSLFILNEIKFVSLK